MYNGSNEKRREILNISFLVSNYYPRLGGMEYAAYHLANSLSKLSDTNVSVACNTLPEVPKKFSYPHTVYRSKKCWHFTPWLQYLNRRKMIAREKTNILHGHMLSDGGLMALQLNRKYKLPVIVTSHGSDVQVVPEIQYGECLNPERRKKVQEVIRDVDHIIAPSSLNRNDIIALGGKEENITIIPNGIHWTEIQTVPFTSLRSRYGISEKTFVLITIGRNRPIKRMELLFQSLQFLKELDFKCICVGPKNGLETLVKQYGLVKKVILTGVIQANSPEIGTPNPEFVNLMRSANLYISASYRESFGIAAAESLASGTPILVGKNHGICDIIETGKNGYIMQEETPEAIANQIQEIQKLSYNTTEVCASVKHLDWGNIANQTQIVYKNFL